MVEIATLKNQLYWMIFAMRHQTFNCCQVSGIQLETVAHRDNDTIEQMSVLNSQKSLAIISVTEVAVKGAPGQAQARVLRPVPIGFIDNPVLSSGFADKGFAILTGFYHFGVSGHYQPSQTQFRIGNLATSVRQSGDLFTGRRSQVMSLSLPLTTL